MRFTKMHGCANDYVVLDARDDAVRMRLVNAGEHSPLAERLCDRRRGVGADGLVYVLPESRVGSAAAFEMRMHNPDGSASAMCGNALRCVAKWLVDAGEAGDSLVVRTADTVVPMRVVGRNASGAVGRVEADLGPPRSQDGRPLAAAPLTEADLALDDPRATTLRVVCLSMGNPHCVVFTDQFANRAVGSAPVESLGRLVETHPFFPDQTNVEFVELVDDNRLRQRTWERGAGETLACGSGACAAAVAAASTARAGRRFTVELLGGELKIDWREADDHVLMTGPAEEVFRGVWPDSDV